MLEFLIAFLVSMYSVYSGNLPALVIVDGSSDSVEVDRTTSYEILTPDQIMQRLSAIRGSIPTAQ